MRNIAISHLLPAVTASIGSGLVDYALSASPLRGACLGGLVGVIYSVAYDILDNKFAIENGFIKHGMAVITSAVMTFGAAFITSASGLMAMPSLMSLSAIFVTAIAVDAIFRVIIGVKQNNDIKSPVSPSAKKLEKAPQTPVDVAKPDQVKAPAPPVNPAATKIPVNPPSQPHIFPLPMSAGQGVPNPAVPNMPNSALPKTGAVPVASGASSAAPSQNAPNPAVPKTPAQAQQFVSGAAAAADAVPVAKAPATAPSGLKAAASQSASPAAAAQPASPASPLGLVQSPQPLRQPQEEKKLKKEADIKASKFPLLAAIRLWRFDLAETLMNKENANCEDENKDTPLSYAVRRGHKGLVEKLIGLGAQTNCINKNNMTLLHQAAHSGNLDLVVKFQTGALEVTTDAGYTPLAMALSAGHDHVVAHLQLNGAKMDFTIQNGDTPLHLAVHGGSRKYCTLLMNENALKAQNKAGETPLAHAVLHRRFEIADAMVQKKANVNTTTRDKKTLLHIAAERYRDTKELERV
ncbi:MAG: ankyrin repeat domain-containing protein, partial [Parachlamydia sp.]|nr:ankyrin repeat domain-containing protein [Parachlamydia sp.]